MTGDLPPPEARLLPADSTLLGGRAVPGLGKLPGISLLNLDMAQEMTHACSGCNHDIKGKLIRWSEGDSLEANQMGNSLEKMENSEDTICAHAGSCNKDACMWV